MKLYKSTIVIWSEFNPVTMELSDLAREAETGDAYCSRMEAEIVQDPASDVDWDGTEFFNCVDAGCDKCGMHDREPGSLWCSGCNEEWNRSQAEPSPSTPEAV